MAPTTVGVITDLPSGIEFGKLLESSAQCSVAIYSTEKSPELKETLAEQEAAEKKAEEVQKELVKQVSGVEEPATEKAKTGLLSRVRGKVQAA